MLLVLHFCRPVSKSETCSISCFRHVGVVPRHWLPPFGLWAVVCLSPESTISLFTLPINFFLVECYLGSLSFMSITRFVHMADPPQAPPHGLLAPKIFHAPHTHPLTHPLFAVHCSPHCPFTSPLPLPQALFLNSVDCQPLTLVPASHSNLLLSSS